MSHGLAAAGVPQLRTTARQGIVPTAEVNPKAAHVWGPTVGIWAAPLATALEDGGK
jgi:hypothetical protein